MICIFYNKYVFFSEADNPADWANTLLGIVDVNVYEFALSNDIVVRLGAMNPFLTYALDAALCFDVPQNCTPSEKGDLCYKETCEKLFFEKPRSIMVIHL